jgi:hypothetical protein
MSNTGYRGRTLGDGYQAIPLILRSANRKSVLELHNQTGEDACPEQSDRNVDAQLKRQIIGRQAVVTVTNGRLDGSTEASPEFITGLAEVLGTWAPLF